MKEQLDLSVQHCNVCRALLERDIEKEKEWCPNKDCSIHGIKFSIPYKQDETEGQ